MGFSITSPAFSADQDSPGEYTCDGKDVSPLSDNLLQSIQGHVLEVAELMGTYQRHD